LFEILVDLKVIFEMFNNKYSEQSSP